MGNQEDLSLDENKEQHEEQRGTIYKIGITGITYRRPDGMTIFESFFDGSRRYMGYTDPDYLDSIPGYYRR